nr:sigma 54-interacting transcriptional regulator [Anaerobranca gottschalkii]
MERDFSTVNGEDNTSIIFDRAEDKFLVVDDENNLVGILTKKDLLRVYYEKLKYTTTNLNAMLESASNSIIAIDLEYKITYFNRSAEKIVGKSKSEVLGKDIREILPQTRLPAVVESGEAEIGKTLKINDYTVIANRTPIKLGDKIIGAVSVFQDITDYENVLLELDKQKNITDVLNTVMELAYDGILVVDKQGHITMISDAYSKFLGVNKDEVIGKHVTEVIENTRMHIVAQTGVPEVADLQKIKGNYMIATRIPIIKNGESVGAVGKVIFRNVKELDTLYKKVSKMEKQLEHYKGQLKMLNTSKYSFNCIVGKSNALEEVRGFAKKASLTDSNVLIIGESGTGKELFAHAIHNASSRSDFPFVKVNCAAIPNELLESELFGYEEGSFTGAKKGGKIGKFELADGGTIFLDEIGDMPLQMQAKLLRVLQEKEVERIGAIGAKKIDTRIIAATNQNLEVMVKEGKFRGDLYYRLNVLTLNIPPLRERPEDIEDLVIHMIDKLSNKLGKYVDKISPEAMEYLKKYSWPGNVRELENVLERAINLIERDTTIQVIHLPEKITGQIPLKKIKSLNEIIEEAERQGIIDALRACNNNRSEAARLLKISRSSLYEKMGKYNL